MRLVDRLVNKNKKENVDITDKYRALFLHSPYGPDVLSDILIRSCHFCSTLDPENPASIAEYNVGVSIMHELGIFNDENAYKAVEAMCKIPEPAKVQKQEAKNE